MDQLLKHEALGKKFAQADAEPEQPGYNCAQKLRLHKGMQCRRLQQNQANASKPGTQGGRKLLSISCQLASTDCLKQSASLTLVAIFLVLKFLKLLVKYSSNLRHSEFHMTFEDRVSMLVGIAKERI